MGCELYSLNARFQAQLPPLVRNPTFMIRKKASTIFSFEEYVQNGFITKECADYLINAVQKILSTNEITDKEEFSFLDCTIGLGSDSIVVSYAFPQAKIKGLEGSLPIWLATSYGLAHYSHNVKSVTDALRRIEVSYDTFENYVPNLPDESIDIIYFDPMFEVPVEDSPQFKPLRGHTVESHIDDKIMEEAMRVASYGVIIKERPFSSVFQKYPPHQWVGGKYSRIGYGAYMKELL